MKITQSIAIGMALACFGAASLQATDVHLTPTASGSWDSTGAHASTGNYQIGYSLAHPNQRAAYFVYDLTPVKGKTITGMGIPVVGSTDFHITDNWTGHPSNQPSNQFKVGITPQCNPTYPITLANILTGPNSTTLYLNASDANRNQDGGYSWVQEGLHTGQYFGCWHYANPKVRIQNEVNAGGSWAFWACDRFNNGAGNENYIWGSTSFTTANYLDVNY